MIGFLLIAALAFQVAATPRLPDTSSIRVERPNYTYSNVGCNLSPDRFRNLNLIMFLDGRAEMRAALRTGKYKKILRKDRPALGWQDTSLQSVQALGDDSSQTGAVLMISTWTWGGASSNDVVLAQLFDCAGGKLHISQQIVSDVHGGGDAGVRYDKDSRTLTVRSVDADSGPHCCPTALSVGEFRWNGKEFSLIAHRKVPIPQSP